MAERSVSDLKDMMWSLPIHEEDDALRAALCETYGKDYPRQWFLSACCEDAIKEALQVDMRANLRLEAGVIYLRYRGDFSDDGMAIWRTGEEDFQFFRWQRILD